MIAVSLRARPEQVERALANGLTKATALTERRRAGKPLDVPDALGKDATGEFLSPTDLGKIAELRVMRRQHAEAQAEGPAGAARAERLGTQIRAFERQLAISDDSPGAQHRRRMVETQVVVQNDRARGASAPASS
ncbi:MAG: hypothetical protein HS111_08895 [Kofleriaceae bacterium]|nr:hypothetical protein [Kofleriaceae bacterium]